jgi:hypothetical protein
MVTSERARTGSRSLKITIPAALSGGTVGRYQLVAGMPNGKVSDDRWYGVSVFLAADWNLLQVNNGRDYFLASLLSYRYTQIPDNGPGNGINGRIVDGQRVFNSTTNLGPSNPEAGDINTGPIVKGQWVDFVMHIKWSKGSDGVREIWRDGAKQGRYSGPTITKDSTFEHRFGIYEGTQVNHTRTLYLDNHRVGTSYAAVDPSR